MIKAMKRVSIQALKARLSAVVAEAESGNTIVVTRHNAPVALVVGEPFDVPQDADESGVEAARESLESRLRALEQRALELIRR